MTRIKVMTFNLESTMNVTKGYYQYITKLWRYVWPHSQEILMHVSEYINEEGMDIVTLTEVDGGSFRTKHINQLDVIANLTGLKEKAFFPLRNFMKILNQGNGILTKHALKHREYYHLESGKEARYIFDTVVEVKGHNIHVMVTHLALGKKKRKIELDQIASILKHIKDPVILCGDFNTGDVMTLSVLNDLGLRSVKDFLTFPSWHPKKSFDHIFVSDHFKIISSDLMPLKVSDHLGMMCELELT